MHHSCTHSSKRYTSKLKAKHIVQKRQFRKSHPDSHYCAASFRYMRDYAVKYRNLSLFVCIDDKYTIKVGEPGFPLGTFSRILFSQTDNCAPRTISFLLFHSFFIVHRSLLTAGNLIKVKAQQSFKKFHL